MKKYVYKTVSLFIMAVLLCSCGKSQDTNSAQNAQNASESILSSEAGNESSDAANSDNADSEAADADVLDEIKKIGFEFNQTDIQYYPEGRTFDNCAFVTSVDRLSITEPGYDALSASFKYMSYYYEKEFDNVNADFMSVDYADTEDDSIEYPLYNYMYILPIRYDNRIFSVSFSTDAFLGGAHPDSYSYYCVFDSQTGKKLKLSEAVNDYDALCGKLILELEENAEEYGLYDDWKTTVTDLINSDKLNYCLDSEGIQILFNGYQIAPYICGPITVTFLYNDADKPVLAKYSMTQEEFENAYYSDNEYGIFDDDPFNNDYEPVYDTVYDSGADYIFPDSANTAIAASELASKELYQLRRGLNEIYARHGRIFNNAALSKYFNYQTWYNGTVSGNSFDESVLNKTEKDNIKAIQAEINKRTNGAALAELESSISKFLNTEGVNGFMNVRFEDAELYPFDIADIVYQLTDNTVDVDKLYEGIESSGEEIFTDITYISSYNLDKFLRNITDYGIGEKEWNWDNVGYYEPMAVYYVQHGDTNRIPIDCELHSIDGNNISVICYPTMTYDERPFVVILSKSGNSYKIRSSMW